MDKSRQQFEEEFKKQYPIQPTDSDVFIKEIAFKFWQASRESLDVELPQRKGICHNEYESGYFDGVDKCEDILISNGVKIK